VGRYETPGGSPEGGLWDTALQALHFGTRSPVGASPQEWEPRTRQARRMVGHHCGVAWEWVAPVCTTALGAFGIAVTGLTARGGRKHAENFSNARIQHEQELAEDARAQGRLGDAYVELLSIVNRSSAYADSVRPFIDTRPPAPIPPIPSLEEQSRAEALVMAYGSRAVEELFEAWRQSVWEIIRADQTIGLAQEMQAKHGQTGINESDTWRRLMEELKPAQRATRKALAEAIAVELRSRKPAQVAPQLPRAVAKSLDTRLTCSDAPVDGLVPRARRRLRRRQADRQTALTSEESRARHAGGTPNG
jgi:hypothetical protein